MTALHDRLLPLDQVHNGRDFGGYAVSGGGYVAMGQLFRTAHPFGATEADMRVLLGLGLATVVDLRGPAERRHAPSPWPRDFGAAVIETQGDTASLAPHLRAMTDAPTPADAVTAMVNGYRGMPFQPQLVELFGAYLRALAAAQGPLLIHCMAGKDRTGLGVALLHKMLGVHDDDVIADYLLTNTVGDTEARIAAGIDASHDGWSKGLSEAVIREMMMVRPDYLHAAFAAIDAQCGGLDGYMDSVLSVGAAEREAIRARLIVSAAAPLAGASGTM